MPYIAVNIDEKIEQLKNDDKCFKKAWDNSQEEYRIIMEIVALRRQKGITQSEVAEATGIKQQALSRMEKRENSPTLRTICLILNKLGCRLEIKQIEQSEAHISETTHSDAKVDSVKSQDLVGHISPGYFFQMTGRSRPKAEDVTPSAFCQVDLLGNKEKSEQRLACVA